MTTPVTVYENSDFFVVLHDRPAVLGHMRIFPKQPYGTMEEVPRDILAVMFDTASKCATLLFDGLQCQGTNILVLNGKAANQTSERFCIEVVPRFEKDGLGLTWQPKQGDMIAIEAVAKDIASKVIIPKEEAAAKQTVIIQAPPVAEPVKPVEEVKKTANVEFEPLPKSMFLYELLRMP
ncbi:MAG TPA: HIT family protein [Acidobacteriota bacterium]|nr:HIT family protein [Acidobacteriota bacterium]